MDVCARAFMWGEGSMLACVCVCMRAFTLHPHMRMYTLRGHCRTTPVTRLFCCGVVRSFVCVCCRVVLAGRDVYVCLLFCR